MAQSASQSGDTATGPPVARPKYKPIDLDIEAPSLDFTQDITKALNDFHDEYRGFKKELRRDYDLHYSMTVSIIPQWGIPDGGPGVVQMVYTPYVTWSPFTDTAVGSGSFAFAMQQTQFWTKTTTKSQQARLGLITPPNDQTTNVRQYNQLMYTHTLPDTWSWLSVTAGQYTFAAFDSNQYAGNVQTNFISYPLAQNGTQTYPYGALGAYAQAATPDQQFTLAGGFQSATNVVGNALSTRGFATGKSPISWLANGRRIFSPAGPTASLVTASPRCPAARQQPGRVIQRGSEYRREMGPLPASERGERNRDPDRDLGSVGWDSQQPIPAQ